MGKMIFVGISGWWLGDIYLVIKLTHFVNNKSDYITLCKSLYI